MVKALFRDGDTYTFDDIFDIVPKTVISKDLGMNYHTFTRKSEDPERFAIREIILMAKLFSIDPQCLSDQIFMTVEMKKRESCEDKD